MGLLFTKSTWNHQLITAHIKRSIFAAAVPRSDRNHPHSGNVMVGLAVWGTGGWQLCSSNSPVYANDPWASKPCSKVKRAESMHVSFQLTNKAKTLGNKAASEGGFMFPRCKQGGNLALNKPQTPSAASCCINCAQHSPPETHHCWDIKPGLLYDAPSRITFSC